MTRPSSTPSGGRRRAWQLGIAVLLSASLAACYPDRSVGSTEDLDLVLTLFDDAAEFSTVTTYTLVDSIPCQPITDCELNDAEKNQIRQRLRTNLNALGWTERPAVGNTSTADVIVGAGVAGSEYTIVGGGWCDYYYGCGYYPPGWGWYYPPTWYTYSFETGTLVVAMTDRRASNADDGVRLVWTGAVNGVLEGSSDAGRALTGIDQMFAQSPYLRD